MRSQIDPTPAGHLAPTVVAIGCMAALLAAGLGAVGLLGRMDFALGEVFSTISPPEASRGLPVVVPWVAVVLISFALPLVMLSVPGMWRRVVLWVSALALVAGWAPVLALAARQPVVSGVFIATFWCGLCSLVYASRHRMPCDPRPVRRRAHEDPTPTA